MKILAIGKPEGSKLLRVSAEVESKSENAQIVSLSVRGDFFAIPEEGFEEAEASLRDIPLKELAAAFDAAMAEKGVRLMGISGKGLAEILRKAIDEA
ncbi:MAG: hypothetical protein NT061_04340 [Spirochaetes bacterium]|nr:hypothetical protein [Spirochaetota bacterium]